MLLLRYNRQTDSSLERQIDELWTERVSREPWLFNGAKFRLHSFCLASTKHPIFLCSSPEQSPCTCSSKVPSLDSADNVDTMWALNTTRSINETEEDVIQQNGPLLTLRLGLTCYKDYLGTNWSCQVKELRQRGEAEFSDALALLSQPLGVGAILCTDDGQVVLIRRSQRVAEAGGLLDIPGGHPEPKVG